MAKSTVLNTRVYDTDHTSYNAGLMFHAPYGVYSYLSYSTSVRLLARMHRVASISPMRASSTK